MSKLIFYLKNSWFHVISNQSSQHFKNPENLHHSTYPNPLHYYTFYPFPLNNAQFNPVPFALQLFLTYLIYQSLTNIPHCSPNQLPITGSLQRKSSRENKLSHQSEMIDPLFCLGMTLINNGISDSIFCRIHPFLRAKSVTHWSVCEKGEYELIGMKKGFDLETFASIFCWYKMSLFGGSVGVFVYWN